LGTPLYEIRALTHSYAGKTVLSIEQLTVASASIVGLIGPNGSGKSSFLRCLGLIERPSEGEIRFDGKPIEPFSHEARFLITLLPQEPFLMQRSVFGNVSYGLKLRGKSKNIAREVDRALSLVGLPFEEFARRPWYALSGGEAQRVALAARLVLNPRVLLLDEPTASVDAVSAQLIKEAALRSRQESGTTLIVASHDWQWLYEVCDEILHMFKGRFFGTGRETMIFGPWRKLETGRWGKTLSDDQQLIVPAPPDKEAAAVIHPLAVSEDESTHAADGIVLSGMVSRLSFERKTGRIFATVIVGDLPLTVGLTHRQAREQTIFPGKKMVVRYRLDQVKWI
jgi:tungstate transport system ATP-binding protein